jgi:hypothetical protein
MHEYLPRTPPAEPIQLATFPESRALLLALKFLVDLLVEEEVVEDGGMVQASTRKSHAKLNLT